MVVEVLRVTVVVVGVVLVVVVVVVVACTMYSVQYSVHIFFVHHRHVWCLCTQ